jgi:hypothetical protein
MLLRDRFDPCTTSHSTREIHVSPIADDDKDVARRERAIQGLTKGAGASLDEVRGLFALEFARLARGAKVREYLHVLTTSNVRAELRRADEARRAK